MVSWKIEDMNISKNDLGRLNYPIVSIQRKIKKITVVV